MSILSQASKTLSSSPRFILLAQQRFNVRDASTSVKNDVVLGDFVIGRSIPYYNEGVTKSTLYSRSKFAHSIGCSYFKEASSSKVNLKDKLFSKETRLLLLDSQNYHPRGQVNNNSVQSSGFRDSYESSRGGHRQRKQNHYHQNYDHFREPNFKSSSIPLLSLVGAFGLFRSMNADDLEEEKMKLTDEQKMKKMKPIELLIAKGVLAMCDEEHSMANDLFHRALHIAQDEDDEENETLVLNLLASNFFECGDYKSAEKLFIDLMKRLIAKGAETNHPAILELSLKLASIYSKNPAAHEKAMKGFKFVINALLSNLEDILFDESEIRLEVQELSKEKRDELALLGWSYDWFAKHLLVVNNYIGAVEMLQHALKISSKVLGPLHDQTLILLNDVGTTLAMSNSPEEGKTFIEKAVEGAIKSQSKELASFYVNLGLIEMKLKRLEEAKRYCEYSIELASKNPEHHTSSEVIELSRTCLNEVKRLFEANSK